MVSVAHAASQETHAHCVCEYMFSDTAVGESSHEFHMHCIVKWLSEKHEPLCPLCKRPWGACCEMLFTQLKYRLVHKDLQKRQQLRPSQT